ncbi:reverse transcriptase domain-containing protein [Tanacetum coccineum]
MTRKLRNVTAPSGTPPLLPIPLPTPSPPLLLPSTDCRAGVSEVTLPPQKRLCIALGLRYKVDESLSAPTTRPTRGFRADYGFITTLDDEIRRDPERYVGYGITNTWDEMLVDMPGAPSKIDTDIQKHVERSLNLLQRDKRSHAYTALLMEREARLSPTDDCMHADVAVATATEQATTLEDTNTIEDIIDTCDRAPKRLLITKQPRDADRSLNGEDSHDSGTGVRRQALPARECTYPDFMKCKPLYFKGTEGTVGHNVAYAMTWKNLKKKMTDKYCPRGEIKKLEAEMWNLKVKGTDVVSYNQHFQELALMCARMFPEESDKIKKYVGGLPDMIHGSSENKRKQDDNQQQQQNNRQNIGKAYSAGSGEKKPYGGSKPLCSKCNYHHDGQCAPKRYKCNRVGHLARDCMSTANANTANNQRGTRAVQKPTCYECGAQGHFKRDYPKLKNNNRGNQGRNGNAPAKVYVVGCAGTNPDSNVVMDTFLLNNRYASVLFDTGADRSFVSTTFSSQIDITPSTLDHYYDVELADGRIIGFNAIESVGTLNC